MTLYAIAEDYDNGLPWEDNEHYDNQLIGLFESKEEAMSHLKDGVLGIFCEDKVSAFGKYVISYHYGREILYRRLVEVETGKIYPYVWTDSILCSKNK